MIIAFSGLGGSGKSSHIGKLSEHISKEQNVRIIALREHFLWPKLVTFLRGGSKSLADIGRDQHSGLKNKQPAKNQKGEKNVKTTSSSIYYFIRDLFYIFDAIRIRLFIVSPHFKKETIIFDRALDDFAIELAETSSHTYLHHAFVSVFGNPTLHFYLKSSPETVLSRKHEDSLEVLRKREALYEKMFKEKKPSFQPIIITTEGTISIATETILRVVDAVMPAQSSKEESFQIQNFQPEGWALYQAFVIGDFYPLLSSVIIFDPKKLFETAIANRMANIFLEKMLSNPDLHTKYWQEDWHKYDMYRSDVAIKREKTLAHLAETFADPGNPIKSSEYSLVKNDEKAIELSGDIDIVCFDLETYNKMLSLFKKSGKVIVQTKEKADIFIDGLLPIDLHFGLSFGNFRYASDVAFKNVSEAEARFLTIIAHAVAELTLVTLGDILKIVDTLEIKNTSNQEAKMKIENLSKSRGWGAGYQAWIRGALYPEKHGYTFPKKMSTFALVRSRLGLFLREPFRIGALIKDLWLLALALRARNMGKTPFHEHWTEHIR